MAIITILKRSGAKIELPVVETAEAIYMEVSDMRQDDFNGRFFRKSDFAVFTLQKGPKIVINKRYICYATDQ